MEVDPDNLYTDLLLNWENDQKIENIIRTNKLNLNKTNSEGKTLLGMVVSDPNSSLPLNDVVKCLLKHAANPLLPLSKTQPDTIAKFIVNNLGYKLIRVLYVPVDSSLDEDGNTLFHLLAEKKDVHCLTDLLVGYKHTKNKNGETPLHISIRLKDNIAIRHFLKYGSDDNEFNDVLPIGKHKGLTPLIIFFKDKDFDLDNIYLLLKDHKVDVNVVDHRGNTALHLMAKGVRFMTIRKECEKLEYREFILKFKSNINVKNKYGSTPLIIHCSSVEGNFEFFHLLLSNGADVEAINNEGNTALHYAARKKNLDILKSLLKHKVEVNVKNSAGSTPLSIFCNNYNCSWYSLMLLLEKEADVNVVDKVGNTPLHYLCSQIEHIKNEIFEHFLSYKPIINCKNAKGLTPLLLLSKNCHADHHLFSLLCKEGADVNVVDEEGNNLLHLVSAFRSDRGKKEMLKLLLTHESFSQDANASNNKGSTPLHVLCRSSDNNIEPFNLLLEAGADVNKTDGEGNSALHLSAAAKDEGAKAEILSVLLTNGAKINMKNWEGLTPLEVLFKRREEECELYPPDEKDTQINEEEEEIDEDGDDVDVKKQTTAKSVIKFIFRYKVEQYAFFVLLRAGADVTVVDDEGNTLLHLVAAMRESSDKKEILKMVLNRTPNVNAKNKEGLTPLIVMCKSGDFNFSHYSLLLTAGADTKATDSSGCTPLHFAVAAKAKSDKCEVMKLLLKHGADVNARNQSGSTPLIELCRSKENGLMKFNVLLEHGADVNMSDDKGYAPLHHAAGNNSLLCYLLVANRADVNAKTHLGISTFQLSFEDYRLTEKLMECGVDMAKLYLPSTRSEHKLFFCEVCWKHILLRKSKDPSWKHPHIEKFLERSQKVYPDRFRVYTERVKSDIEKLKAAGIGKSGVTLYDIVTSNLDQNVVYMRDERIRFQLPLVAGLSAHSYFYQCLSRKLNQALIRRSLLDSCIDRLHVVINRDLPLPCLEKILSYLGEEDLNKVIKTFKLIR